MLDLEKLKSEALAEMNAEAEANAKCEVKNIISGIVYQQRVIKGANAEISKLQEKLKAITVETVSL